jgi:phosphopantetheine--protein transferase-like protein
MAAVLSCAPFQVEWISGRRYAWLVLAVGLDIECADNLPAAGDPASEPFYQENFTPAEIAWCLGQPDPRMSFCSVWTAKEAALKCGGDFATLRPIELEVRHEASGRPLLRAARTVQRTIASDCALSLSRAGSTCIALCIRKLPPGD